MTYNATESFNQALEMFSSLYQDMSATDVPPGLSPDNQDVQFLPGGTFTRAALNKFFSTPEEPTSDTVSVAEFPLPDGDFLAIWLSSLGNLWQKDLETSAVSQIGSVSPGSQFRSVSAFSKQWFALYNASLAAAFSDSPFVGTDVPQYYDGQNRWRVTQDAPGANPVFANIATLPVSLTQSAPTGTATVTSVISSGAQRITEPGQPGFGRQRGSPPTTYIIYTSLTYGCSAPVSPSWLGTSVAVAGITGTNASLANVSGIVIAVSGSSFTLGVGTGQNQVNLTGQSGTATLAGNYFSRTGNIVTVYLGSSLPSNLAVGLYVRILNSNGFAINGPNWTIDATGGISRDATGLVTVTIDTQLSNLAEGSQLYINAADTTDFPPGLQTVFQVVSATGGKTTFTISNSTWGNGAVVSSNAGGSVYQTWNGTFQIQTAALDGNGNAYITYFQLGPDITLGSTGGTPQAQLQSQLAPGPRNAVLIFEGQNAAQTAPSIPIQLAAVGGTTLLSAQQIPIGPFGTKRRIIAFTAAYGSSYYYIAPAIVPSISGLPPVLSIGTIIADNMTTLAIIDFSDQQLQAGTRIDIQGNDLFNQIVLAPCLGCVEYEGRMLWWGEINNVKNLINSGFDGGYNTTSGAGTAGSGANSGAGVAWSNPSNIASSSAYADVALSRSSPTSQFLNAETFAFSLSAPPGANVFSLTVTALVYATGTPGDFANNLTATLLKAGVPIGSPVSVRIVAGTGSPANPLAVSFPFSLPALTASDLTNAAFGVQFQATYVTVAAGNTDLFINTGQISYAVANNFPLGWNATGSSGGIGVLVPNGTLGFAYQMTGSGGSLDCLIAQGCFQDYYGNPIMAPGKTYLLRLLIGATGTLAGNFICDIVSPSKGTLATATIAIGGLEPDLTWAVATFNAELPASMPSDAQLRIYLQSSFATVTIDELEFIPQDIPVNFQQMRASYFDNPFGYDDETGIMEIDGSWKITGAFTQRSYLYALTDGPMFQSQNNGQTEPNDWGFSNFADECDCFGPNAVVSTEDISWWAGPLSGVRVFNGSKPQKISQEIQPTWDLINDTAPLSVWVANDPDVRCLYIGVPTGSSTTANLVIPMSYRNVGDVANDPAPLRQSLSGKMIPLELCRKWTRWNMPMLCGAMITQQTSHGAEKQMLFGGQGHGNLYWLNPAKFTDDDYGTIASYYTTCFFFNHETEQSAPGLGLHRKLFNFLSLYVSGVGQIQITPLVDNLNNPWTITPTVWNAMLNQWSAGGPGTFEGICSVTGDTLTLQSGTLPLGITQIIIGAVYYNVTGQSIGQLTLSVSPGALVDVPFTALYTPAALPAMPLYPLSFNPSHDLEWAMNVRGERVALKIAAIPLPGQTDAAFNLQHLVIAGKADRAFPVRGALL